ncbi:MAG: prohibitin family protein [Chloroflexi bacterium]|nr:prohibitin family protein [Chloroflexota bacterium]MCX6036319.1 prohibitin family protein [Chloroflexota bacterium]MDP2994087.1 prohibitin family protein [Anaerolineales bacterium]
MNIASVLQGLATFSWLLVVGIIVLAVIRASRAKPLKGAVWLVIATVIFSLVLTTVSAGLVFLQADQYGIVISALQPTGYRTQPFGPGLHWVVPFLENVQPYSIAKQTYTMATSTGEGQVTGDDSIQARTKDGQQVFLDASVIYSIDPAHLVDLHIAWQNRFEDLVVRPVTRAAIRDAVSQFGVEEIVSTKRSELEQAITDAIRQGLAENNLMMDDFLLRNIRFSDEYAAAVEQKQIAEQLALQAKFVVEQRKQEAAQAVQVAQGQADAVVIAAQGEAQAILLKAQAQAQANQVLAQSLSPELLTYTYINKLAPNVQVMYLPSGTPLLLPSVTP